MIFYTSEVNSGQICVIGYQYDEGFKNLKIHSYGFFNVVKPKYPYIQKNMKFQDTYVDDSGTLVSATALIDGKVVFTAATEQNVGGKNSFGYLSSEGEFIDIKPCKIEVR